MAGVISTGNIARLLQPGVKSVFGNEYKMWDNKYAKLFDESKSNKAFELDVQFEGFGLAPRKYEGNGVAYDSATQGFVPKYQNLTYGLGFIVTKEAMDDNQYDLFASKARRLARSMKTTKEVVGANVYNRAFNSSYTMVGGDGKELLATDHVRGPSDSTTWSNELSVPAALSEASLEDLLILIQTTKDPRGLNIQLMPERLIVAPANGFNAQRILKSELQNDTANNAVNAVRTLGLIPEFVVNPYLSSTTAWFVKTNCPDGVKLMNRQDVEFDQDMDFGTSDVRFKAMERYAFGWSDPRGLFGSEGV
jgi:hypothetical protein